MSEKIQVLKIEEGQRLDLFLTFKSSEHSRSFVKKQIEQGRVKINEQIEYKPNYKVAEGDVIETSYIPEETEFTKILPQDIPLKIVYEDNDLIVIDKPIGMVVHPATSNWDNTLLNAIAYKYKDMSLVGDKIRSGLIHRLDKDTSGLVMVGKTNKALWYYTKLFSERKVKKTYLALVKGNFSTNMGMSVEVENYLGRNEKNRKKFSKVPPSKGKYAKTSFRFMKSIKENDGSEMSLIEANPQTGRTHQIRVHLAGLGHPIMGDQVYGRGNEFFRLMLHAWKLKLVLINGEEKEFIAKPDRGFEI